MVQIFSLSFKGIPEHSKCFDATWDTLKKHGVIFPPLDTINNPVFTPAGYVSRVSTGPGATKPQIPVRQVLPPPQSSTVPMKNPQQLYDSAKEEVAVS
jgi:hypothetical protein